MARRGAKRRHGKMGEGKWERRYGAGRQSPSTHAHTHTCTHTHEDRYLL